MEAATGRMGGAQHWWCCKFGGMYRGLWKVFVWQQWQLALGLQLAISRGILMLELQVDSQAVASLLNSSQSSLSPRWSLLHRIREYLQQFCQIKVIRVYREGNMSADVLARLGNGSSSHLIWSYTSKLNPYWASFVQWLVGDLHPLIFLCNFFGP